MKSSNAGHSSSLLVLGETREELELVGSQLAIMSAPGIWDRLTQSQFDIIVIIIVNIVSIIVVVGMRPA